MTAHGFGRRIAPDPRDRKYSARRLLKAAGAPEREHRYWWARGWNGDQGATSQCVAYAILHAIEDGPVTWPDRKPGAGPVRPPGWLYTEAQNVDEWEGNSYEGTSVRAGMKVLHRAGLIGDYLWMYDGPSVVRAVLTTGPVVLGTYWFLGMMDPDANGRIHVFGPAVGGHAYVVNGASLKSKMVRIKNSWGKSWSPKGDGHAWLSFDDLDYLVRALGEAVIATERPAA